ncbi:hypothetical protein HGA88_03810 [Candidatus Roizmanbacteria bacterium]|nr:hypothetical protein [Candidatus Roizmanbacteria bacterium]
MNAYVKLTIWSIFTFLITANVFIFMSGMSLGDEINKYESKTVQIHQENIDLEKQVYNIDSLSNAATQAVAMNFTKKTSPVYLEQMTYALNR